MRLKKHRLRIAKDKLSNTIVTPFTNILKIQFMKPILIMDYMMDCNGCKWNTCNWLDTEHCEMCSCGDLYEREDKDELDSNNSYSVSLFNLDNLSRARKKAIKRSKYVK